MGIFNFGTVGVINSVFLLSPGVATIVGVGLAGIAMDGFPDGEDFTASQRDHIRFLSITQGETAVPVGEGFPLDLVWIDFGEQVVRA